MRTGWIVTAAASGLLAASMGCSFNASGSGETSDESGSGDGTDGSGTSGGTTSATTMGTAGTNSASGSTPSTSTTGMTSASTTASTTEGTTTDGTSGSTGEDGSTSVAVTVTDGSTGDDPCVPAAEVCDGVDNDCDDLVDEGSPDNASCNGCSFVLSADTDHYFAICGMTQQWANVSAACQGIGPGSDAAIIDDAADQATLVGLVAGDTWIGLSDLGTEGTWLWIDGTNSLVGMTVFGYDGWAVNQPSGGTTENCAELDPGQSGWADSPCSQAQPYICRHPA